MHYTMPISQRLKKLIKSLHQKQFRDQNDLFVAEGERLVEELINHNYDAELVVIKDSPSSNVLDMVEKFSEKGVPIYTAPKHQFDQICDTKSPQTILAVANIQERDIDFSKPFVALDGISDPGNVGTIIRTAEWFGVDQIILGRDCADTYNPKTVRSTMGAVFKSNIVTHTNLADFITENYKNFNIYGASLESDLSIEQCSPAKDYGIVFGSEAHGLSEDVNKILTQKFKITGYGESDSLNVAVSAGIVLYHCSLAKASLK